MYLVIGALFNLWNGLFFIKKKKELTFLKNGKQDTVREENQSETIMTPIMTK